MAKTKHVRCKDSSLFGEKITAGATSYPVGRDGIVGDGKGLATDDADRLLRNRDCWEEFTPKLDVEPGTHPFDLVERLVAPHEMKAFLETYRAWEIAVGPVRLVTTEPIAVVTEPLLAEITQLRAEVARTRAETPQTDRLLDEIAASNDLRAEVARLTSELAAMRELVEASTAPTPPPSDPLPPPLEFQRPLSETIVAPFDPFGLGAPEAPPTTPENTPPSDKPVRQPPAR